MTTSHTSPSQIRNRFALVSILALAIGAGCGAQNSGASMGRSYRQAESAYMPGPPPAQVQSAPGAPSAKIEAAHREAKEAPNTEAYDRIVDNDFSRASDAPLSTFSIDVDTASYSNVRRFLSDGALPPPDAVRVEELVNYFAYDYPAPTGAEPFSASAEVVGCPWAPEHRLLRVGLQGRRMEARAIPPRNLVFLLDVSGSMEDPRKLPLLREAFKLLAQQLRPEDTVSIAVYAGASGLVLPPTSGADQRAIMAALERLQAGGSTNGGAGIELAYRTARATFKKGGINRVILATDGDFNVGVSSQGDLLRMVERERESGVFLTVLGLGTGNVKDSTMEQLADKGNGNYAYLDTIQEARKVLVEQAGATLVTIAKDVKIQIEFNPREVQAYRLIGYENRVMRAEDFNDDKKDAGEIGAGHSVTALYEIVPAGVAAPSDTPPKVDPLKYQTAARPTAPAAASGELAQIKIRYKEPTGTESKLSSFPIVDRKLTFDAAPADLRFASSVAAFGMLLRDSKHKGAASWSWVRSTAQASLGQDKSGYRAEFVGLVDKAAALTPATAVVAH